MHNITESYIARSETFGQRINLGYGRREGKWQCKKRFFECSQVHDVVLKMNFNNLWISDSTVH